MFGVSDCTSCNTWLDTSTLFPSLAQPQDDVHQIAPRHRIGAGQRLVEKQHFRIVHQRLGQFDPLPHPLRVAANRPALVPRHADRLDRPLGGGARFAARQARSTGRR